jgi:hypothetical protein
MNLKFITYITAFSLLIAGTVFLASCKKEVNDDLLEVPAYSEFGTPNLTGRYFVPNSPTHTFKIPVGITNVSSSDRTIQLSYTSPTGAVAGTHFTAPTSIVIPAGKALDSLGIHGIYANYPVGRKDTIKVRITGGDVDVNSYNNEYTVVLERYCDVVLSSLTGAYTQTRHLNSLGAGPVGPYTVTFSNPVSTGPTSGQLTVNGLRLAGFGLPMDPIVFNLDWADPANFKVIIDNEYSGWDYDPGQPIILVNTSGINSTFSSCSQTYTLTVDFLVDNYFGPGDPATLEGEYSITIRR